VGWHGHAAPTAGPIAYAPMPAAGPAAGAAAAVVQGAAGSSRPSSSTGCSPSSSSLVCHYNPAAAVGKVGPEAPATTSVPVSSRAGSSATNTADSCRSGSGAAATAAPAPAAAALLQHGSSGGCEQGGAQYGGSVLADSKQAEQDALRAAGYVSDWESSLQGYKEFVVRVATFLQRAEGAVPGEREGP
jgi:hypothetical protein